MALRNYGIGAQILKDLKVKKMRLLALPRRMPSMAGFDLEVTGYAAARRQSSGDSERMAAQCPATTTSTRSSRIIDGAGLRIGIVMSRFNSDVGEGLLSSCTAALLKHGVARHDMRIVTVPGALEAPLALQKMAQYADATTR